MPSEQECAERLREQAYRTLLPQIRDLEQELERLGSSLTAGLQQIGRKLEALSRIELPTTEAVLREFLEEIIERKDLEASSLVRFARDIREKETQEEILGSLLDGVHRHFSRVALFAVRGDRFVGWSSRGYPETLAQSIASCSFPRSECPQLQAALEGQSLAEVKDFPGDGNPLHFLRASFQGPWQILPLYAMQRPVAVLLAEGSAETSGGANALAILAHMAVLRLENIALKILYELTVSRPEPDRPTARQEAVVSPESPATTDSLRETQPPSKTAISGPEPAVVEEPVFAAVPDGRGKQGIPGERADSYVTAAPQSGAREALSQEAVQAADEEKSHADAKRFARLLVSEIKLYNEHHVLEGRKNGDLYLRLKRDIDKSREMYEKRVSPVVSQKIDYFHDEIVRILGDNDPSTLGSDYPGPRVES